MCYQSWKAEFYSELTDEIVEKMTALEATEHALKKWEGALPENLEKHGVKYKNFQVKSDIGLYEFTFDHRKCSLCQKYEDCKECPLFKYESRNFQNDPYYSGCGSDPDEQTFYDLSENNPEPMIHALKETIIMLKKEENGTT